MAATSTVRSPEPAPTLVPALGTWDVVAMTVVGVVTLRWITRAARIGPGALLLWALAWLVFFVPLAAAVTELSSRYPHQGGIYAWTRRALGPVHAFICGWCLWVNNLFYFPSLLLFAAANAVTAFGDAGAGLADSRVYSVLFVMGALWFSAALAIVGFKTGRWFNTLGALAIWLPALLLIAAGCVALATRGSATSFAIGRLVPRGDWWPTLGLWSGICFAFSGFEVTTLVGQEVRGAKRAIPRGVLVAGAIVTLVYVAGTASVLISIPAGSLLERSGIADAVALAASRTHGVHLGSLAGLILAVGAMASSSAWFASSGRVPFAVGLDRACPPSFARLHPRFRTPYVALLVQAVASSLLFLVSVFVSAGGTTTVQDAYDILVNLTILVYFIPYLYLFASLFALRGARTSASDELHVPGGRPGVAAVAATGFGATAVSLLLVFVPPPGGGSVLNYEMSVIVQTVAIVAGGLLVYGWSRKGSAPE